MDLIDEIIRKSNLPKSEILKKVDDKYSELSGLVTMEGAALLVARELGIEVKRSFKSTAVGEIKNGMKNVNVVGRIFKISDITEFKKSDGTEGRVANIWIGDDSGFIRVPLWNDQTQAIESSQFKIGDLVQIFNGLARQNPYGYLEVSLGKYGGLKLLDDSEEVPSADFLADKHLSRNSQRIEISKLSPGNFEIAGIVINVLKGDFIFYSCPQCRLSIKPVGDVATCSKHGKVEATKSLVISCVLDDTTGDVRTVFFREQAEQLVQSSAEELLAVSPENRLQFVSDRLLGKEILVSGKVKLNQLNTSFEMIASSVKDINPLDESKKLVDKIKLALGG